MTRTIIFAGIVTVTLFTIAPCTVKSSKKHKAQKIIIQTLTLILLTGGCGSNPLSEKMKAFMNTEITIPQSLIEINNGHVSDAQPTDDSLTLVIYYGRDDCSACQLSHMKDVLPTLFQKYAK